MNVPLEKRYLTIATGDLRKRLKKAGFTSIYQLSTVQDISYATAKIYSASLLAGSEQRL